MKDSGLREIIPLICTAAIWGQYPVFWRPEFPQGSPQGVTVFWWLLDGGYSFPCWVSSGLTGSHWRAAIADDYGIFVSWCGRRYSISHQGLWSPEVSWARWKHLKIFTLMLGNKEGQDSEKRPVRRHCLVWGTRARVTGDSWKIPRTTLGSSSGQDRTTIREAAGLHRSRALPVQLDSWRGHLWGR